MIKTQILLLVFRDLQLKPSDIPKLRGYFANKLDQFTELHNHLPGNKFDYRFPRIQYRIIYGNPALVAIHEGIDVVKRVFLDTNEIILDKERFLRTNEKIVQIKESCVGQATNFFKYNFISPWLALNESNYHKYRQIEPFEQQQLLKKILRGNLMTLSKGFHYTIPDIEKIKIEGFFHPKQIKFKNVNMQAFTGSFLVNFYIPNWFGLGKQSARGFGVINLHNNEEVEL